MNTLAVWLWLLTLALPCLWFVGAFLSIWMLARFLPSLDEHPIIPHESWPQLSVIIPACNEAHTITEALTSIAELDYPALEVIAVNDRSTDGTGEHIEELATRFPHIKPIHIEALPEGWLGKLNALQQGIAQSQGDWLLLTDADVVYAPQTLQRAISYAETHEVDLLAATPKILSADFWGDVTINTIAPIFGVFSPLWKMNDDDAKTAGASGAFILIRKAAYERTPGLEWLRLEVADDFGVALMLKQSGARCHIVDASKLLRIRWYTSFADLKHKTQKNFFAILGRFQFARCLTFSTVFAFCALVPWLAIFAAPTLPLRLFGLATLLFLLAASLTYAIKNDRPVLPSFLPSLGLLQLAFVILRAGWIGLRKGGIVWRDTLYTTEQLRDQQRVKF